MQFVLPILYSIVFIFLIYKIKFFAIESLSRTKLTLLFILKLIVGIIVWLVYSQHYTAADFHTNFSDSTLLIQHLVGKNLNEGMKNWDGMFDTVLYNNSRTMIIINAILQLFSFGNFYVHLVFFCFFSFLGLTAFYKAFVYHFPTKTNQLIIALFLVPSILFWTSAISKESLTVGIVGLIIYITNFGLKPKYVSKEKLIVLLLFLFLVVVKVYVAIALVPVLLSNMVIAKTSVRKIILKYISVLTLLSFLAFFVKIINPDYNLLQLLIDKQAKSISEAQGGFYLQNDKNFIYIDYYKSKEVLIPQTDSIYKIKKGSEYISWKQNNMKDTTFISSSTDTASYKIYYNIPPANTVIKLTRLKPNLFDFIKCVPVALYNVLFQPTVFNIKSWLHLVVTIENMWLIILICLAFLFYDKKILQNKEVVFFCLMFTVIIFTVIGITTPVIGSMIRYRTIGLLFFICIVLLAIDFEKIKDRFPKK